MEEGPNLPPQLPGLVASKIWSNADATDHPLVKKLLMGMRSCEQVATYILSGAEMAV